MVARKVKLGDRDLFPSFAALPSSVEASEQLALLALSSIRGVGYWTLSRMAKAGIGFAAFLRTDDSTEAGHVLRSFGAKLENKMTGEWRTERTSSRTPRAGPRGFRLSALTQRSPPVRFGAMSRLFLQLGHGAHRPDWLAGVVGLESAVVATVRSFVS
jgi:hypothetical protein